MTHQPIRFALGPTLTGHGEAATYGRPPGRVLVPVVHHEIGGRHSATVSSASLRSESRSRAGLSLTTYGDRVRKPLNTCTLPRSLPHP